MNPTMRDILDRAPVIPVIVVQELPQAVPLARALLAGGLPVLEVTLRTAAGLPAIEALRREVPEAIVGVGTLSTLQQLKDARAAGAQFGVAPGLTHPLVQASQELDWPFLPGVMTPSELMRARELGLRCCKLFPAMQAGGIEMLKALHAVFPDVAFCPTGGISADNAAQFLALPNVPCVGGSWVAPAALLQKRDWEGIRALAEGAAALRRAGP